MTRHQNPRIPPEDCAANSVPMVRGTRLGGGYSAHQPLPPSAQYTDSPEPNDVRTNLLDTLAQTGAYVRRSSAELRQRIGRFRRKTGPFVTFAREMLASPRTIGAVCPSSPHLAWAMARELGGIDDGLVLELGAGTGSITHALLQQGVVPARLIAVERSPALSAQLRQRFPSVRVIEGDATRLGELLGTDAGKIRAVVSGLPLRSLPHSVVQEITKQVRQLLPRDGVFVQFTYDLRSPPVCRDGVLKRERSQVIWKNMPPARVDTFIRKADRS